MSPSAPHHRVMRYVYDTIVGEAFGVQLPDFDRSVLSLDPYVVSREKYGCETLETIFAAAKQSSSPWIKSKDATKPRFDPRKLGGQGKMNRAKSKITHNKKAKPIFPIIPRHETFGKVTKSLQSNNEIAKHFHSAAGQLTMVKPSAK